MDFYEVVEKRMTIRDFSSKKIEEEKLKRILNAGLKAPSHNHLRQWEFILLKDPKIRYLVVVQGEKKKDDQEIDIEKIKQDFSYLEAIAKDVYVHAIPKQKKMLLSAPELLVVCYKIKKPIRECDKIYDLNSLVSAWCCIENILLAMAAEGLFGVPYIPQHTEKIKKILNIPEDYEVPVLIPIGYPAKDTKRLPQKEIHLEEKIHINKW